MALRTLGDARLTMLDGGSFHLDGGAMHGVVPKTLWSKLVSCDAIRESWDCSKRRVQPWSDARSACSHTAIRSSSAGRVEILEDTIRRTAEQAVADGAAARAFGKNRAANSATSPAVV